MMDTHWLSFEDIFFYYTDNELYIAWPEMEDNAGNVIIFDSTTMATVYSNTTNSTPHIVELPENMRTIEVLLVTNDAESSLSGIRYSLEITECAENIDVPIIVDKMYCNINKEAISNLPYISLNQTFNNTDVQQSKILLSGTCTNTEKLYINDIEVTCNPDGSFSFEAYLEWGLNPIEISAVNADGEQITLQAEVSSKPLTLWGGILIWVVLLFSILGSLFYLIVNRNKEIPAKKRQSAKETFKHSLGIGVFLIFIVFIIKNTIVSSASMEPTLMTKNCAVYNQLAYIFNDVQHGDIVSYWSNEHNAVFSKRVIGLAGDEIHFQGGDVYINGAKLDESDYLNSDVKTYCSKSFIVPEGCVFVLGDNREGSLDSRFFKQPYINTEDIYGKYLFSYPNIFNL